MPESWDPADSLFLAVSFHHTHTLTHTQREKGEEGKRKKKKKGRNIWQAGVGLALLSAEKVVFQRERGERAGCHTRAWQGRAAAPTAGTTGTDWSHLGGANTSFFGVGKGLNLWGGT